MTTKKEYRHIGKNRHRQDGVGIVTGRQQFCDDLHIPGLLVMKVLRSPYAHADIVSIDTTEAEAMTGVVAVMTYKNAPDWKVGTPAFRRVLDPHVKFVGDAVATVAAVDENTAIKALEAIKVEYNVLPAVYNVRESILDGAPEVYRESDNIQDKGNKYHNNQLPPGSYFEGPDAPFYFIKEGDVEKGYEEADVVVEGTVEYAVGTFPGAPEPPFTAARWEDEDHLTMWGSSQGPNMLPKLVGMATGKRVTVIAPNCGGSYGNKDALTYNSVLTAATALVAGVGKPVRFYMTKPEQMSAFERRLGCTYDGKIGMKKDGTITAIGGDFYFDTGVGSELTQGQVAEALGETNLVLNHTPNWDVTAHVVCTNRQPVGIARGFGGQEFKACSLHLLSRAMKALDLNPLDVFTMNFNKPGELFYWRTGKKYLNPGLDYTNSFNEARKRFDWDNRWKGWTTPSKVEGNKAYGVGFSVHASGDPQSDECSCYVRLENDQIIVHSPTPESGMGQRLAVAKTVAETFDVDMNVVSMTKFESLMNPVDFGLTGSRGTITHVSAAYAAACDAKKKLFETASKIMGVPAEELETKDMLVYPKGAPEKGLPFAALIPPYFSITGVGDHEGEFNRNNCVLNFVEVCVDLDTGKVVVTDALGASDVGKVMSPFEVKMQLEGGLGTNGIDSGHLEGYVLDPETGRTMNNTMIDYKWSTFNSLPHFDTLAMESVFPTANPYGGIGIGEITGAAAPAAVLMAIENALGGLEINEYPATPDKILRVLGKEGR